MKAAVRHGWSVNCLKSVVVVPRRHGTKKLNGTDFQASTIVERVPYRMRSTQTCCAASAPEKPLPTYCFQREKRIAGSARPKITLDEARCILPIVASSAR